MLRSEKEIFMTPSVVEKLQTTVDELPTLVGRTFGPSSWREITQQEVQRYADLSGDNNPIHTDPDVAAKGPFGTTIAHGYLTLGLVVPLMAEIFEVVDMGTGVNYGLDRLRFPAPVPVGSSVRVNGSIGAVSPIEGGYQIQVDVVFEVSTSPKPACVAQLVLRYYK
ncbi:MaoC family dehydratase [Pseudarthrobacter sp. NPDC058329]|uniref:MaoC family dehydratase n=1 Tax=Pseudarthrobacter sp. NPDC058329 TaxID=3346448 RepID=UPI0036D81525